MRLLQKTSLMILLIPTLVSVMYNQWPDAIVNASMGATSLWHHTKYNKITLFIDRLMIPIYTYWIINISYSEYITLIPVISGFIYLFYSYIYGYYNKCGSFHRDCSKADKYHAINHIYISLIGSLIIIWHNSNLFLGRKIEIR
jgi:hypothetical protein